MRKSVWIVTMDIVFKLSCRYSKLTNSMWFDFLLVLSLGCEIRYYGENCSTCDHCKNNATCGIERGECDSFGCATGYIKTSQSETCQRKAI